jgi:hypothetical protein
LFASWKDLGGDPLGSAAFFLLSALLVDDAVGRDRRSVKLAKKELAREGDPEGDIN